LITLDLRKLLFLEKRIIKTKETKIFTGVCVRARVFVKQVACAAMLWWPIKRARESSALSDRDRYIMYRIAFLVSSLICRTHVHLFIFYRTCSIAICSINYLWYRELSRCSCNSSSQTKRNTGKLFCKTKGEKSKA
jgi:hypothetical protein